MLLKDYKGYEWGWILQSGVREEPGTAGSGMRGNIVGIWGKVYRDDIERPFYLETFLHECKDENDKSIDIWSLRPLMSLINLNMQRCLKFAYPEDYPTVDETLPLPEVKAPKTKTVQLWKCTACGHTFYTEVGPRQTIKQFVKGGFMKIRCDVCTELAARKVKKVVKEIRQ